jgi:NADH dehydrogenase FAD-containing subunit
MMNGLLKMSKPQRANSATASTVSVVSEHPEFSPSQGSGATSASSSPAFSSSVPHVVIIGGGYAGTSLGRALELEAQAGKIRLTLIERRDTFHHKIGAIRASVLGKEYIERIRIPLKSILKYSKIIQGSVSIVDWENDQLIMEDGSTVQYNILVGATGTLNHSSGDLPPNIQGKDAIREYYKEMSRAISQAQRICIVGGGPTAVEYAGEIRACWPSKKIQIVSSSTHLLSSCVAQPPVKFMSKLYEKLKSLDIDLIRGEKVIEPVPEQFVDGQKFITGPIKVRTKGFVGMELECDLLLWAASWQINNDIYPTDWLNSAGEINIKDNFLVADCAKGNVFAFGDICSIAETKQAITLGKKVGYISHNILAVAAQIRKHKSPLDAKLKDYCWCDKVVM